MADKLLDSFPVGQGKLVPVDHTGPTSYTAGGETLGVLNNFTGMTIPSAGLSTIDAVLTDGATISGLYSVRAVPTGTGSRKTFKLLWINQGTGQGVDGATVVLGTTPTNATYTITATTGVGQIVVVVAGGAITSVTVTNPGFYAAPPTFTPPAGLGTGATITATVGSVVGIPVAAGTNLSAQVVRLVYVGR